MSFEDYKSLVARSESVGAALMCARLASKLSIEDLSDRTKVSTRFLKALECDDFAPFPGRVYVLGFAKAYARVVGLDCEGVVAALRDQLAAQ